MEEAHRHLVLALLEGVGHLLEHVVESHDAVRHHRRAVDRGGQVAVSGESETQTSFSITMYEHGHVALVGIWVHHHIHSEALAHEVSGSQRTGIGVAIEVKRRGCDDVAAQRRAQHLKVVDLAQVVAGDRLRKLDLDGLADVQDAVGRLWQSERHRQPRVLDSGQDRRGVGEESPGMARIDHGPEVVVLLHRVGLSIELCHDDSVLRDGVGHSARLLPQLFVGIVGAYAHPVLLTLCGELVLQLHVVEPASVDVESLNPHRHVPSLALAVVRALGVDHPVVARRGDLDASGRRDEMGGEVGGEHPLAVLRVHDADGEVLVVEVLARIDGDLLGEDIHLSGLGIDCRIEHDVGSRPCERRSVHTDARSLRVAASREEVVENQSRLLRIVGLVGDVELESCRLVERHVALHRLVNPDPQLVGRDGGLVEHGSRLVPLGHPLSLVRLAGDSTHGPEHEVGIDLRIVGHIVDHVRAEFSFPHIVEHVQREVPELAHALAYRVRGRCPVNIHRQA